MARLVIANALSINMLPRDAVVMIRDLTAEQARKLVAKLIEEGVAIESAVGHEATAKLASKILGVEVPVNRREVKLDRETAILVIAVAERLPEGKVLSDEELEQKLREGKIRIALVMLAGGVGIDTPGVTAIVDHRIRSVVEIDLRIPLTQI